MIFNRLLILKKKQKKNTMKLCIKCGEEGHNNKSCKNPVTSFGLVVYTKGKPPFLKGRMYPFTQVACSTHKSNPSFDMLPSYEGEVLFLLVERKDTVGFLNLIQGSYPDTEPFKSRKIAKYVYELTCEERMKLLTCSFSDLWKIAGSKKKDFEKAEERFKELNISNLLNTRPCFHQEADYLMPKGRLKFGESIKQCAIREFSEETGFKKDCVQLLTIPPFEEEFTGTDGKIYRNVFFVGLLTDDAKVTVKLGDDPNQSKEVRNIGWFNITECLKLLRDYHQDKMKILSQVYNLILAKENQFKVCSSISLSSASYNNTMKNNKTKIAHHAPDTTFDHPNYPNYESDKSNTGPQSRNGYWRPYSHRFVGNGAFVRST